MADSERILAVLAGWRRDVEAWREKYGPDGWDGTPAPIAITEKHIKDVEEAL